MRYFSYSLVVHIVILAILAGAYIFMPTFTKPKDVVVTIVPYQEKQEVAKEETPKKETIKPKEQPKEQPQEQQKELPAPNETTTPKEVVAQNIPKVIASKNAPIKSTPTISTTATSPIKESKKEAKQEQKEEQKQESSSDSKAKKQKAVAEYRAYVQQKIESAKEYPKMAQKLGQIGTVRVAIVISKDGSVSSASIVSSSGFSTLDTPTKRLIENMRFKPLPVEIEDGFLNLSSIPVNYRDDD